MTALNVAALLDNGAVVTGDLTPTWMAVEAAREVVATSWRRLRELGATRVYPAHGPVRAIPGVGRNESDTAERSTILRGLVGSTVRGLNVQDGIEDPDEMDVT